MKIRYYVKEEFPFSKYERNSLVFPTKKEVLEFKKYPRIFEDKTVLYEILERGLNNTITKVKCLKSKEIFKIGDLVIYKMNHLTYHCAFTITGFEELADRFNDIIYTLFDGNKKACSLSKCKHLLDVSIYEDVRYLENH